MKKDVRYSRIDNIEDVIKDFSNKSSYGNVNLSAFYKISASWDSIVGTTLIKFCKPVFYARQILTIVVADSTWANELMFSKAAMIKKIGDMLNIKVANIVTRVGSVEYISSKEKHNTITDSVLEQKKLTDQEQGWIDSIAANIENKELRDKLMSTLSVYVKTGGDIEQE